MAPGSMRFQCRFAQRWGERWSANGSQDTIKSAAIAANFLVSTFVLVPAAELILYLRSHLHFDQVLPVVLMITGTVVAASIGRVVYQIALSVTGNDNGFVTMFFLMIPALTALISLALSRWIPDLHFAVSVMFYLGLTTVSASLLFFSLKSWERS